MRKRVKRGLRAAVSAARSSHFYAHRVGAAIFKGAAVISLGCNLAKTHPQSPDCYSTHAEFSAILKGKDVRGASLFVARLTRTNKVSCAKPCESCQQLIEKAGISRVFYTNYNGEMEEYKVA